MRIAYLSTFYPFRGGIAQFNALLYHALKKQGYETKAFTFSCQYPSILFPGKTQYVSDADNAIHVDSEAILNSVNPFSYETTFRKILDWEPDVLVMSYWMSFFAPSLGHVANRLKRRGVKVVCVIHNAIPHEPHFFDKPLAKLFFNQCTDFVVMSNTVKDDLLSLKPDAHYKYLPHPLYNHFGDKMPQKEALHHLGMNPEKKTLLFFGLIRDYKGLDLLIQAMSSLDDSYQLLIAGECYGSFEKYEALIAQSSAKNRIKTFNRYIDDTQVSIFFSSADLLVLPYKSATQSGVIPVAYHFDLPVLATDVGGLRETLEPSGTGLICQANADSLSRHITQFFRLGKEPFQTSILQEKEKLSWEKFAIELMAPSTK